MIASMGWAVDDTDTVAARLHREVTEIAEVLARRQGKSIAEVWTEALALHRVRYETEVLTLEDEKER
jgi:hypothetical protein